MQDLNHQQYDLGYERDRPALHQENFFHYAPGLPDIGRVRSKPQCVE